MQTVHYSIAPKSRSTCFDCERTPGAQIYSGRNRKALSNERVIAWVLANEVGALLFRRGDGWWGKHKKIGPVPHLAGGGQHPRGLLR